MDGMRSAGHHRFLDVVESARLAGFEVYDALDLPVDEEHRAYLEDENLAAQPAHVEFLRPDADQVRGVVAVVSARDQQFRLRGEWRRVPELRHLLGGAEAPASRRPDES